MRYDLAEAQPDVPGPVESGATTLAAGLGVCSGCAKALPGLYRSLGPRSVVRAGVVRTDPIAGWSP